MWHKTFRSGNLNVRRATIRKACDTAHNWKRAASPPANPPSHQAGENAGEAAFAYGGVSRAYFGATTAAGALVSVKVSGGV